MSCHVSRVFVSFELTVVGLHLGYDVVEGRRWKPGQRTLNHSCDWIILTSQSIEKAKDFHGFVNGLANGTESIVNSFELTGVLSQGFAFLSDKLKTSTERELSCKGAFVEVLC